MIKKREFSDFRKGATRLIENLKRIVRTKKKIFEITIEPPKTKTTAIVLAQYPYFSTLKNNFLSLISSTITSAIHGNLTFEYKNTQPKNST